MGHRLDRPARHRAKLQVDDGVRHAADGRLAFPYSEFLPKEGKARGVQIDIDASMVSIRFPMEVGLVGDAAETLRALLPRLRQKQAGEWRATIEDNVHQWWKTLEERAKQPAKPVNPQRVTWELSPLLPDRVVIT